MVLGEPLSYVVKLRNLNQADARIGRCWSTDRNGSEIQLSDDTGCTVQVDVSKSIINVNLQFC